MCIYEWEIVIEGSSLISSSREGGGGHSTCGIFTGFITPEAKAEGVPGLGANESHRSPPIHHHHRCMVACSSE